MFEYTSALQLTLCALVIFSMSDFLYELLVVIYAVIIDKDNPDYDHVRFMFYTEFYEGVKHVRPDLRNKSVEEINKVLFDLWYDRLETLTLIIVGMMFQSQIEMFFIWAGHLIYNVLYTIAFLLMTHVFS